MHDVLCLGSDSKMARTTTRVICKVLRPSHCQAMTHRAPIYVTGETINAGKKASGHRQLAC